MWSALPFSSPSPKRNKRPFMRRAPLLMHIPSPSPIKSPSPFLTTNENKRTRVNTISLNNASPFSDVTECSPFYLSVGDLCILSDNTKSQSYGSGTHGRYFVCDNPKYGYKITQRFSKSQKEKIKRFYDAVIHMESQSRDSNLADFFVLPIEGEIGICGMHERPKSHYIMPHVNGEKLSNITQLNDADKNGIYKQLVYAIEGLHNLGFFHNDLKADNVILYKRDPILEGTVKIKNEDTGTLWHAHLIDFDEVTPIHTLNADQNTNKRGEILSTAACREEIEGPEGCADHLLRGL